MRSSVWKSLQVVVPTTFFNKIYKQSKSVSSTWCKLSGTDIVIDFTTHCSLKLSIFLAERENVKCRFLIDQHVKVYLVSVERNGWTFLTQNKLHLLIKSGDRMGGKWKHFYCENSLFTFQFTYYYVSYLFFDIVRFTPESRLLMLKC